MDLTIAIDIDGVVADLHEAWLKVYNKEFNDNKTVDDIKTWAIKDVIKPECSYEHMKAYLTKPGFYEKVKPIDGALEGVNSLRKAGYNIIFVTDCIPGSDEQKYDWAVRHGFVLHRDEWFVTAQKFRVVADILVDDKLDNIKKFPGVGIVFSQLYNYDSDFSFPFRMKHWREIHGNLEALNLTYKDVLAEAKHLIYGNRQKDYGDPTPNYERVAKVWSGILLDKLSKDITAKEVTLCMSGLKLAREAKQHKRDNLVDAAAYAEISSMIENREHIK